MNKSWSDCTVADIEKLNSLNAIFVAAPREMSRKRLTQLVKHYLPKAPIVFGVSREPYVVGFEDQPQFKMMTKDTISPLSDAIERSNSPHKVTIIEYSQDALADIVTKLDFKRVLLVNGSWKYAFHNLPTAKVLKSKKTDYKFISPFIDEDEALTYLKIHTPTIPTPAIGNILSEAEMIQLADSAAYESFDNSFQTGAALGKKTSNGYEFIMTSFNKVVPYQTYALHYGNSREKHESQPHDTNHYDTIHAEMLALTRAINNNIDLNETSLFVNLLPCPNCARTLSQTTISEIIYRYDHSDGYAKTLLELCGKTVRKI